MLSVLGVTVSKINTHTLFTAAATFSFRHCKIPWNIVHRSRVMWEVMVGRTSIHLAAWLWEALRQFMQPLYSRARLSACYKFAVMAQARGAAVTNMILYIAALLSTDAHSCLLRPF